MDDPASNRASPASEPSALRVAERSRAPVNSRLAGVMVAVVLGIAAGAYYDADRESRVALEDFAQVQATLAQAVATGLLVGERLARLGPVERPGGAAASESSAASAASPPRLERLLGGLSAIERPRILCFLLHRDGESVLHASDGTALSSPHLIQALARGEQVVRLSRAEAADLGLHARTALAGIGRLAAGQLGAGQGAVQIVAVASAERERDRERWALRRLVLSVLTAA